MTDLDLSQCAAQALRRHRDSDRGSHEALSRDHGIAIVAEAMHRRKRTLVIRRQIGAAASASVAVAAAVAIWLSSSAHRTDPPPAALAVNAPSASFAKSDCSKPGACVAAETQGPDVGVSGGDARFLPGGRIDTPLGQPRHVTLHSGTKLRIAGGSSLVYEDGSKIHRFSLLRGHAEFSVVKQRPQERFLVGTPDAEIEVHGTVFEVALNDKADACHHRTQVVVSEGIVEVRSQDLRTFVSAGSRWPEACVVAAEHRAATSSLGAKSVQASRVSPASPSSPAAPLPPSAQPAAARETPRGSASDLAKQNELFAVATREMQAGHYSRAVALYEQLNQTYPSGPLAESAAAASRRARELASRKSRPFSTDGSLRP